MLKTICSQILLAVGLVVGSLSLSVADTRIAVFTPGATFTPVLTGLKGGLAQLGYTEGKNATYIEIDTNGFVPNLARHVASLLEKKPDVIVSVGTAHTAAVKQATTTVPIVFTWVGDPLRSGFISSYASSRNNLTGVSVYFPLHASKRLEILKEVAPGVKRVLGIVAPNETIAELNYKFLEEIAQKLSVQMLRRDATSKEELERMLQTLPKGSFDAIYHIPSVLVGSNIELLIQKAKEEKIALVTHEDTMVEKGATLSYGADFRLVGEQASRLVAKVLKGSKPAEIPVQTPDRVLMAINLTSARNIGLKISPALRERTDRFFE